MSQGVFSAFCCLTRVGTRLHPSNYIRPSCAGLPPVFFFPRFFFGLGAPRVFWILRPPRGWAPFGPLASPPLLGTSRPRRVLLFVDVCGRTTVFGRLFRKLMAPDPSLGWPFFLSVKAHSPVCGLRLPLLMPSPVPRGAQSFLG